MSDTACFTRTAGKSSMHIDFMTKKVTKMKTSGYFYDLLTVKLDNHPNDILLMAEGSVGFAMYDFNTAERLFA